MAYLDGVLELMSPSHDHEYLKTLIARLVEAYAETLGLSLNGFGSETLRKKRRSAGGEPDECYVLGGEPKPFPDVAIEVVWSSGGVDKLEIYRRLGVREVWFFVDGRFQLFALSGRAYHPIDRSRFLPDLDLDHLADVVRRAHPYRQTETVRAYRRSLRRKRRRGR
jgi:Uma2 family endonuclease